MSDEHPELAGYEASDGPYRPRRAKVMRAVVLVALAAMLLPLVLSAVSVARSTAARACFVYVETYVPDAAASHVRFDLFEETGAGWQCDWITTSGVTHHLGSLGLIPSGAVVPPGVRT
ncbi:hypothetical protein ARHIZOSPH14_25250 [Agromyces rhizosphaerae]|uniref:Uncharacterized protein n=1 Tax=Agromyces rhizosphaerae TaxID=88374 RepID=A0A9W6D2B4_9MICO|nr:MULTISPECIES: hypothetical protein [Agromyces]BDZ63549.1 hypothetical protein GCM10025877_04870 [Agromyces mangrovi]GLI28283.1 hypothetical protein ARHIZOSPH14_25250 [Agromyces rhizosphaerae]